MTPQVQSDRDTQSHANVMKAIVTFLRCHGHAAAWSMILWRADRTA